MSPRIHVAFTGFLLIALALCLSAPRMALAQEDDQAELVAGNNGFAFDLYHQVTAEHEGNLILSPFSISQAFGMVIAGAQGNTKREIMETMRFTLIQDDLHEAFSDLNTDLAERPTRETYRNEEGDPLQLSIANSLWAQEGYPFRETYLDTIGRFYGGEAHTLDFALTEEARQTINGWIEDQTEDKIQDMIPPEALPPYTRLVLVNAIYFNASWLNAFPEDNTRDDTFTLADGGTVTVPTMFQSGFFGYTRNDDFLVVSLPYFGDDTVMLIIMPEAGTFAEFEAAFDVEQFGEIRNTAYYIQEIRLHMPRFAFATDLRLKSHLMEMGMIEAFGDADLTGMYDRDLAGENLYIGEALHNAYIAVDESGTEAAASTAVIGMGGGGPPAPPPEVRIDHPFIYIIYDKRSEAILFLGRVLNPAESE